MGDEERIGTSESSKDHATERSDRTVETRNFKSKHGAKRSVVRR